MSRHLRSGPTTGIRTRLVVAHLSLVLFAVIGAAFLAAPSTGSGLNARAEAAYTPPACGRYRVVIEGFTVNSETWDHILEVDGKRDEVFIAAKVVYMSKLGQLLDGDELVSATMGDQNGFAGRIVAGRASSLGGLMTGDSFPAEPPWGRPVQPNPSRRYPPWEIWEGDLTQGEHALMITPTIWEWDGGADAFSDWIKWLQGIVPKIGRGISGLITGGTVVDTVVSATDLGLGIALSMQESGILGQARDRPIGLRLTDPNTKTYSFTPLVLSLNYDKAEALTKTELSGIAGLRAFNYPDDPYFRGHYTLYARVEKMGKGNCPTADRTAPSVNVLAAKIGSKNALLRWTGSDRKVDGADTSGVASYDLRVRVPGGSWKSKLSSTTKKTYRLAGPTGRQYQYTVRARDKANNTSNWTASKQVTLK